MKNSKNTETWVRRLSPYRIIEHWIGAVTFGMLVLTGLPQKFYYSDLSQWIIMSLGGIDSVRLIHRINGACFTLLLTQHVLVALGGVLLAKWPTSMFVFKKDFGDTLDNIKYYLGMQRHGARCDRFDYRQKFEYWGVVVGGILMGATGLTLWFPALVTRFIPAAMVPNARALHTNEALLAFLVIIIWHIYNAVFSPEVFPLDTVIFTGKISRERMVHEHPVELARIEGKTVEEIVGEENEEDEKEGLPYGTDAAASHSPS